jgi:hypothetical protein
MQEGGAPSSAATAKAPAEVCARYSTSVIVMVIGAPTAPRRGIIRRRWYNPYYSPYGYYPPAPAYYPVNWRRRNFRSAMLSNRVRCR